MYIIMLSKEASEFHSPWARGTGVAIQKYLSEKSINYDPHPPFFVVISPTIIRVRFIDITRFRL